jgi:hypothetical protein
VAPSKIALLSSAGAMARPPESGAEGGSGASQRCKVIISVRQNTAGFDETPRRML